MVTGQFNKVFYQFATKFWVNRAFIGIIRDVNFRGVCNHWQNVDFNIPGSNILMCTLTNEGMEKVTAMSLTSSDLLDPLRSVYGTSTVDTSLRETFFCRYDLDPAAGHGAYSSFTAGYTLDNYYKFYGGLSPTGFVKGEGYNGLGEWVVFFSGAASCFNYYEFVDGAFFSGQRSARYLLQSLGSRVRVGNACENWN
jgi:Flavin containing amine oxidoreductase